MLAGVTVSGLQAYGAARGDPVLAGAAVVDLETALVRAEDYLLATYPYAALRAEPDVLSLALYEAARLEVAQPFLFSRTRSSEDAKILTGVGADIRWTVLPGGVDALRPRSDLIDGLLGGYRATGLAGTVQTGTRIRG